jgi:hypothetical protein
MSGRFPDTRPAVCDGSSMAVEPARGTVGVGSRAVRSAVTLVTAGVASPVILPSVYMLVWFAPEVTAPGCWTGSGWLRDYDSTILWLCSAAAVGLASTSLIVALRRMRTRRWWVWPLTTLVATAFLVFAISWMDTAAWCPPEPGMYGTP